MNSRRPFLPPDTLLLAKAGANRNARAAQPDVRAGCDILAAAFLAVFGGDAKISTHCKLPRRDR